jgi:toxin HigB-1
MSMIFAKRFYPFGNNNSSPLDSVSTLKELSVPPGNHLEALKEGRAGQHSIRINRQYRICFVWTENGPDLVEITDCH